MVQTASLHRLVRNVCGITSNYIIAILVQQFDIPKTVPQLKAKLREEFTKHPDYTDIRIIDMLVIKVVF